MKTRNVALAGCLLVIAFIAVLTLAGRVLSAPANIFIGPPPRDFLAQSVILEGPKGETISGWFARGKPELGAVLLLHGVRSNRYQMLDRAKSLNGAGYSVLLIDLPAHGESNGARITFGYREAEGVRASLRFLNQTVPGEKTAVIGVSLGAASFLLADVVPAPSAVVLESMYPTISEALANRLRMRVGQIGAAFTPLLLTQLPIQLGINADELRPIDHLSSLHAPVLIASGTEDRHTTMTETKRIFETARLPKELWLVDGAAHVDLYHFNSKAYELRVFSFLAKYLRNTG